MIKLKYDKHLAYYLPEFNTIIVYKLTCFNLVLVYSDNEEIFFTKSFISEQDLNYPHIYLGEL